MLESRLSHAVVVGTTSAVVAFVTSFAVLAGPRSTDHLYAALLVWSVLVVGFTAVNVEPARVPRFATVFCGSLVGLSALFGVAVDYRLLEVALGTDVAATLALSVNPVMSVLVVGALVLSYYGVFACGAGASGTDGRAA